LRQALSEFELAGLATNLDFLRALCADPCFARGDYDTSFIASHAAQLVSTAEPSAEEEIFILAAVAAAWLGETKRRHAACATALAEPWSPWAASDGWRLDSRGEAGLCFDFNGRRVSARLYPGSAGGFRLDVEGRNAAVEATEGEGRLRLRVDGALRRLSIVRRVDEFVVILAGRNHRVALVDPLANPARRDAQNQELRAPLPARVSRILASAGGKVKKGAPLLILESMKTEFALNAPRDGEIEAILCSEGDWVAEGAKLAHLREDAPTPPLAHETRS